MEIHGNNAMYNHKKQKMNTITNTNNLTFTNREEYMAYRLKWKSDYKELSEKIRAIKFLNWYGKVSNPDRMTDALDSKYHELNEKYKSRTQWEIYTLKSTATKMLAELKSAKVLAQEQYLKTS